MRLTYLLLVNLKQPKLNLASQASLLSHPLLTSLQVTTGSIPTLAAPPTP